MLRSGISDFEDEVEEEAVVEEELEVGVDWFSVSLSKTNRTLISRESSLFSLVSSGSSLEIALVRKFGLAFGYQRGWDGSNLKKLPSGTILQS